MAKQQSSTRTAGDVWRDIDSGISVRTGKRVFYQLTDSDIEHTSRPAIVLPNGTVERKSLAFITQQLPRSSEGLLSSLIVFPNNGGSPFPTVARQDDARTSGTWTTANDGDNKDQF